VFKDPVEPVAIPVAVSSNFLMSELPERGKVQNAIFVFKGLPSKNLNSLSKKS